MQAPLGHGRRVVLPPGRLQMPEDREQLRGGHSARGQLRLDGSCDYAVSQLASHSWLGPLESATSWADCLAHFLPGPTGTGWPEKGECPHLADWSTPWGLGKGQSPHRHPWAAPYLPPPLALQHCPSSPLPPLSLGYEGDPLLTKSLRGTVGSSQPCRAGLAGR